MESKELEGEKIWYVGSLHFPGLFCFNTVLDLAINCFGNQLFEKLIYCLFCVYCSSQNEIQNWILLHVQFSLLVKNREREKAHHCVEYG